MVGSKTRRSLYGIVLLASMLTLVAVGCNSGDTDGGGGNDDAGLGNQYVSDGGAGSTIEIEAPTEIAVGEEAEFKVFLRDPSGAPIANTRVFCESEKGIAIIEPSSGGVAFESTSSGGAMSGVLGGLLPGSYMLECRGPEGFNLIDRVHMKITGDVPVGFVGWPGAAGGNLGGGVIIVQDPDDTIELVTLAFSEAGETGFNIDTTRNLNCDGDLTTNDPEPFFANDYVIGITNNSLESITVQTVSISVDDGQGVEIVDSGVNTNIGVGATGSVTGPFTEFITATATAQKSFAGTGFGVQNGTYNVTATVEGQTLSGESFSASGTVAVRFFPMNNCGS